MTNLTDMWLDTSVNDVLSTIRSFAVSSGRAMKPDGAPSAKEKKYRIYPPSGEQPANFSVVITPLEPGYENIHFQADYVFREFFYGLLEHLASTHKRI